MCGSVLRSGLNVSLKREADDELLLTIKKYVYFY